MLCDRCVNLNIAANAALRSFTAGTFHIKQSIWQHDLTNMLYAYMWLHKTCPIPAGMYASQVLTTSFKSRAERWIILYKMAADCAEEDYDGQRLNPFIMCHAQVTRCGLEPLQFNWFRATMRRYNF